MDEAIKAIELALKVMELFKGGNTLSRIT